MGGAVCPGELPLNARYTPRSDEVDLPVPEREMKAPLRLLALSGSLRQRSYNTAALEALAVLVPARVEVEVFRGLGELPLFNPDLEGQHVPAFERLRAAVGRADGLMIASPEYAHGITGVLKNALDWLVSGEEFIHQPVMLINTSPRATHAQAALREVVTTMSGVVVEEARVAIPLLGSGLDRDGILADPAITAALREGIVHFTEAILCLQSE